jgi:hypothetical protein
MLTGDEVDAETAPWGPRTTWEWTLMDTTMTRHLAAGRASW